MDAVARVKVRHRECTPDRPHFIAPTYTISQVKEKGDCEPSLHWSPEGTDSAQSRIPNAVYIRQFRPTSIIRHPRGGIEVKAYSVCAALPILCKSAVDVSKHCSLASTPTLILQKKLRNQNLVGTWSVEGN